MKFTPDYERAHRLVSAAADSPLFMDAVTANARLAAAGMQECWAAQPNASINALMRAGAAQLVQEHQAMDNQQVFQAWPDVSQGRLSDEDPGDALALSRETLHMHAGSSKAMV
jgi:hypothetical protein